MEFPDRNPILVLRTTVSRLARVADAGQSGFYLPTRSKGINERETSAYAKSGRSLLRFPTAGKSHEAAFRFRQHATIIRRSDPALGMSVHAKNCRSASTKRRSGNAT